MDDAEGEDQIHGWVLGETNEVCGFLLWFEAGLGMEKRVFAAGKRCFVRQNPKSKWSEEVGWRCRKEM